MANNDPDFEIIPLTEGLWTDDEDDTTSTNPMEFYMDYSCSSELGRCTAYPCVLGRIFQV